MRRRVCATFDVPEDGVAGETDPERLVVPAGEDDSLAGALAAGQSAAPLAVVSPHHQAPLHVAAGAGGGGAAGLEDRGEFPAGRLPSLVQQSGTGLQGQ